ERPLALEDVRDLRDALDEHERAQLSEGVVERVQYRQEEDARARHARRHVAQDEELGASWTARSIPEPERDAAGLQRRTHRAAHVHDRGTSSSSKLVPLRGESPLQLSDDAVDGREVLQRPARERAIELAQRLRRRQRLGALDQLALELSTQVTLELAQALPRHRIRVRQRRALATRLPLQVERAADPLHVEA